MQIDFENSQQIMAHFALEDTDVAEKLTKTESYKNDGILTAVVIVNGVEIPAKAMEDAFHFLLNQVEEQVRIKYDAANIDKLANERAKEILKEQAGDVLSALSDVQYKLEQIDDMIIPFWERQA